MKKVTLAAIAALATALGLGVIVPPARAEVVGSGSAPTAAETAAVNWAKSLIGSSLGTSGGKYYHGCLGFVFDAYEKGAGVNLRPWVSVPIGPESYPSDVWDHFVHGVTSQSTDPPPGALVFWDSTGGGNATTAREDSHAAISLGDGMLVSTNVDQPLVSGHGGIHEETMAQFASNSWNIYKGWWLPDSQAPSHASANVIATYNNTNDCWFSTLVIEDLFGPSLDALTRRVWPAHPVHIKTALGPGFGTNACDYDMNHLYFEVSAGFWGLNKPEPVLSPSDECLDAGNYGGYFTNSVIAVEPEGCLVGRHAPWYKYDGTKYCAHYCGDERYVDVYFQTRTATGRCRVYRRNASGESGSEGAGRGYSVLSGSWGGLVQYACRELSIN